MNPPKRQTDQQNGVIPFIILSIFICVVFSILFVNSQGVVVAEEHSQNEPINISIDPSTIAALSCLDMDTEEVSNRIEELPASRINSYIRRGKRAMPNSVRNAMANERISVQIDTVYFGIITGSDSELKRVQTGRVNDPTVKAKTECQTVKNIVEAKSERRALEAAISRDEITWEGVTTTNEIATSYGSKGVQAVHILTSKNSSGSVNDAADGFTSGLIFE